MFGVALGDQEGDTLKEQLSLQDSFLGLDVGLHEKIPFTSPSAHDTFDGHLPVCPTYPKPRKHGRIECLEWLGFTVQGYYTSGRSVPARSTVACADLYSSIGPRACDDCCLARM